MRALAALLICGSASAQTTETAPPKNWVNLRIGASSSVTRMLLCGEVGGPIGLSIEGCGTGSGFLHSDPDREIAHFRLKWSPRTLRAGSAWFAPAVGVGFAELQLGQDSPGFQFGGTDATRTATSGFEATTSVRLMMPAGKGVELIADLALSLAYLPHAPSLITPEDEWQPGVAFTVGIGY